MSSRRLSPTTQAQGNDTIHGDEGDDSSGDSKGPTNCSATINDDITGGHNVPKQADTDDWIDGGADADVILGDNGLIVRELLPGRDNAWEQYPLPFDDVIREVTRFDDQDRVSGNDTLFGGPGDDIIHGQRGDDTISGGDDDDGRSGGNTRTIRCKATPATTVCWPTSATFPETSQRTARRA